MPIKTTFRITPFGLTRKRERAVSVVEGISSSAVLSLGGDDDDDDDEEEATEAR